MDDKLCEGKGAGAEQAIAVSPAPSSLLPPAIAEARRNAARRRRYRWSLAAHHEASHAVCGLVLGCQVKGICIGKVVDEKRGWLDGGAVVRPKAGVRLSVFDDVTIALAGPASETLMRNTSLGGGSLDRAYAQERLGAAGALFDPLARRAMSILRRHWGHVSWISKELLERRRIDGQRRLEQADIEVLMQGLSCNPPDRVTLTKLGRMAGTTAGQRLLYSLIYPADDAEVGPEWAIALAEQHSPNFSAEQRAEFLHAIAVELGKDLRPRPGYLEVTDTKTELRLIMALCVAADRLARTSIGPIPSA